MFVYVRVCLWIYWLFNQQASVITCGEVADRWHKEVSSGNEWKWEREKERVFLTAVRLTLTLTSCLCHRVICRADKWSDRVLSRVKGLSSSTKSQLWPQTLSLYYWLHEDVFSADMPLFFTGQDTWSEISWNASCAFLSRISALPNFLRSHCVQMFHIPAWMLLFFVHPHEIHFWRVISRSPCLTITMGYCYSCLLYNFHPRIPNNQYFKLLDVQNTFKTQLQACVWTLKSNLLEQNVDLSLPSISSNAWDCSKFVDLSLLP